jgi:hypothetical protein
MAQPLKAKYQVNRNIYVTCYLDIIEATMDGMKTQVGIRIPGDTILPVGTKLYITQVTPKEQVEDEFEAYYVTVQGVEVEQGLPLQLCSPIMREKRRNMRQRDRKQANFAVKLLELEDTEFTVINGSIDGLTMQYRTTGMLIGLVLGQQYDLHMEYKEQSLNLPVEAIHIQYDWHNNNHLLGVKVLELSQNQEFMLNRLIDPSYTFEVKQSALVDTEEARIRPDMG